MIKLNIGCGGSPLENYVNIDQDSLLDLRKRYPNKIFNDGLIIKNYDIFNLPYENGSISEVNADGLLEHLSFKEEPLFLREVFRVLKIGGIFQFSVPDFEATCRAWLSAEDKWYDFYSDTEEAISREHWFGTNTYDYKTRWGYIMATFYGSQNGPGQYHKNGYSISKIQSMLSIIGFKSINCSVFRWRDNRDYMIQTIATK
jgi:predicted SAM-dependent methyltransferase